MDTSNTLVSNQVQRIQRKPSQNQNFSINLHSWNPTTVPMRVVVSTGLTILPYMETNSLNPVA